MSALLRKRLNCCLIEDHSVWSGDGGSLATTRRRRAGRAQALVARTPEHHAPAGTILLLLPFGPTVSASARGDSGWMSNLDFLRRAEKRRFMHQHVHRPGKHRLFTILALACAVSALVPSGAAACDDRSIASHAAVGITRLFDESEKQQLAGVAGSGWFLTPRLLVTVAHVAEGMRLSGSEWKSIQLRDEDAFERADVRLQRIIGGGPEKIALIEIASELRGIRPLPVRKEPLIADEPVVSRAYVPDRVRTAGGRFVEYGTEGR